MTIVDLPNGWHLKILQRYRGRRCHASGRFHIPAGKAKSTPICIDLETYAVQVPDDQVYMQG